MCTTRGTVSQSMRCSSGSQGQLSLDQHPAIIALPTKPPQYFLLPYFYQTDRHCLNLVRAAHVTAPGLGRNQSLLSPALKSLPTQDHWLCHQAQVQEPLNLLFCCLLFCYLFVLRKANVSLQMPIIHSVKLASKQGDNEAKPLSWHYFM